MQFLRRIFRGEPATGLANYRLRRRLAVGGMGEVWLAQDPDGRRVVVKRTLESDDQAILELCMADEIRNMAALDHPAIPALLDAGEHDGHHFLVLEHIHGDSLWRLSRLAQAGGSRLPDGLILRIGARIAEALAHVHSRRDDHGQPLHLVHRDVTPENMMISHRGEVKLIDFGVSHSSLNERITAPGSIYGKVAYNSPEQVLDGPVSAATDQFQLGVVLWELFAGHRLFAGGSLATVIHRIASQPALELEHFRPDLSVAVTDTVMRCLAFHPMDRHESCEQLAYRLNKLAEIMDSVEGSHYASWRATLMAQGLDPQRLPSASAHQSEPTLPQAA